MKSELEVREYLKVVELQFDEYKSEYDKTNKEDKELSDVLLDLQARIDAIKFILSDWNLK
jgi:hypothetical protein